MAQQTESTVSASRFILLASEGRPLYVDPRKVSVIGEVDFVTVLVVEGQRVIADESVETIHRLIKEHQA